MVKIKISIINQAFFSIFVYLVCTERITSFQIQFSFYIIKSRMILKLCLFFFRNRILYCFFQILFIIQSNTFILCLIVSGSGAGLIIQLLIQRL